MNILKCLVLRGCLLSAALMLVSTSHVWAVPPRCPSGYQLAEGGSQCVRSNPPTCPTGYTLSGSVCRKTERVASTCPEGMSFDSSQQKCLAVADIIITCREGTTYNASRNKCEDDPSFHCPSGYNRSGTKSCQKLQTPTCPSGLGFTLSNLGSHCNRVLSMGLDCPSGSTYNATLKMCEEFAEPYCSIAGQILRQGQCVSPTSGKGHQ